MIQMKEVIKKFENSYRYDQLTGEMSQIQPKTHKEVMDIFRGNDEVIQEYFHGDEGLLRSYLSERLTLYISVEVTKFFVREYRDTWIVPSKVITDFEESDDKDSVEETFESLGLEIYDSESYFETAGDDPMELRYDHNESYLNLPKLS